MGFIDQTGKVVVPAKLEYWGGNGGDEFRDGLLAIDGPKGVYVDHTGKTIIDTSFLKHWSPNFSEGLAEAQSGDTKKWGYINVKGEWAIAPRFNGFPSETLGPFRSGLAAVEAAGRTGFIDTTGVFAIPPQFLKGDYFFEGMARVIVEGPCMYGDRGNLCGEFNALPKGTKLDSPLPSCKFTFIDRSGKIISEDRYDSAGQFSEGLAPVRVGKKWGYIDKTGKMVVAPQFDVVSSFADGVALASTSKLFGYIDHTGKFVIAPQFTYAEDFSEGVAIVGSLDSGVWYIDHKGKQAIADKFAIASRFFKGLAHVKLKSASADDGTIYMGDFAYIDRTGRRVFTYTINGDDFR